ncbi:uncharacterized protein CELE_F10E9.1 [Caenorhabditis elegans]|uniref:Uncharacterized protein F10E9.1 n=1 Tax=Caenorhabditis elegans TaxID=6239 RepID=YLU1_CAEEL|nr:Uncharacterized protein CELE_F10E9.1 [Caenorhabditis elegans]P34395.1 RecName: Full=Uncharacterized protein F10E9.1 [Caenorhabditis elegans]CCD69128.1 Uncharacterized protein CELE_F10E9.1 [Caenorhabditis elegans]|eukprot:NP_498831.1 Uncharacterized protein CELE_F10E9.1 [Caenorhabditis elegans]
MTFEILELLDKTAVRKPLQKQLNFSLRFHQICYAWISVSTIWYIFFSAWFIRAAGYIFSGITVSIAFLLSIAFFCEADGKGWKKFVTLCIICAAPRLFFTPIYAVANIQTSHANNTMEFIEEFHNLGIMGFKDNKYNDISIIWFVYYYNFMLVFLAIQRLFCRKAVEEKKMKIFADTLREEQQKRTENEEAVGPLHI